MTVSARVNSYLKEHNIHYQVVNHDYSEGAYNTAVAAHIPMKKLAKAVLLADHDDKHLLVILPASSLLSLNDLSKKLDRDLRFVEEKNLGVYFADCSAGAIPAIGQAYNLSMIWDNHLQEETDIYIEGGDHKALLHMDREEILKLMSDQPHMDFSERASVHLREPGAHK